MRHAICKRHVTNFTQIVSNFDELKNNRPETSNEVTPETAADVATLKIYALIVSRNVSFLFVNFMVPLFKEAIYDSLIMKNISLNRQKATEIIKKVFLKAHKDRLTSILQKQYFSVIIDEGTGVSVKHSMCIILRYYDEIFGCIRESLFDLVEVYLTEKSLASAEEITKKLIKSFEDAEVPLNRMICFCGDICNLLMGVRNSVSIRLQEKVPDLKVVRCGCHIENTCTQYAMKVLPSEVETLVHSVYNYLNAGNGKRVRHWLFLQKKLNIPELKAIPPAPTRWLMIRKSVKRILHRWPAFNFFLNLKSTHLKSKKIWMKKVPKKFIYIYVNH